MRRRAEVADALPSGWRLQQQLATVSDTAVARVVSTTGQPAVIKIATSASGRVALRREAATLRVLRPLVAPAARRLLPEILTSGPGQLVLQQLPGRPRRRLPGSLGPSAVEFLHDVDSRVQQVGPDQLESWVEQPARCLRAAAGTRLSGQLERRLDRLRTDLAGRAVRTGWVHGDLHPGNLLVGHDGAVCGVLDWDQAGPDGLPEVDVAWWLLTCRGGRGPLGWRIARRLRAQHPWTPAEQAILASTAGGDALPSRSVLLLAWLRHVAGNLGKSTHYAASPWWLATTVAPVLTAGSGEHR